MATKAQAKAAIDSAAASLKADIDKLPTGSNIKDGIVNFAPIRWSIQMDAARSATTAEAWITAITAFLTTDGRTFVVKRGGRRADDSTSDGFRVETQLAVYTIINVK